MQQIETCRGILKEPYGYIAALKAASGRKVVGTFCSYVPEEIILAAGAHPFRIFGSAERIRLAEAHLQSYCCAPVRGALEDGLAGRLAFLDGVVFPHTCDSIQRLSDIWRLNVDGPFHLDLPLPVRLDAACARRYLIAVLERFRGELGERLGAAVGDRDLGNAIRLCNRIRRAIARIDALRSEQPGILRGGDYQTLVLAAMLGERSRIAGLLEEVACGLDASRAAAGAALGPEPRRLILAGGVCSHADIHALITEAGGAVVGDDLCSGSRHFAGPVDEGGDPLAAIADRLLSRAACPAKHGGPDVRAQGLVRIARERRAKGVVFLWPKFCDPHAFDYPALRQALDRAGIPSLRLETAETLPAEGQLRTRLETFVAML